MILRHLPLGLVRYLFVVFAFIAIPGAAGLVVVLEKVLDLDIGMATLFIGVAAMGLAAKGVWMLYRRTIDNLDPQPWQPIWSFVIMGGLLGLANAMSLLLILVAPIRGDAGIPYEAVAASAGFGLAVAVAGVIALSLLHRAGLEVASWPTWVGLFILGSVQPGTIGALADRIGEADRLPIAMIYVGVVSAIFAIVIGWRVLKAGGRVVGDAVYGAPKDEDRFEEGWAVICTIAFIVTVLFFYIGLSNGIGLGLAQAFAISAFTGAAVVMGLVLLSGRRVGSLTVTVAAAAVFAAVAVKLPPATTSVVFIVVASAAVALALKLISVVRRQRRAVFINGVAMASGALVLLTLPSGTSLASRLAALAGVAPEAASREVIAFYLEAYGTKSGRATINLLEGFRPDRAAIHVADVERNPAGTGLDLALEVRNTGEAAIRGLAVYLSGPNSAISSGLVDACGEITPTYRLAAPLLPGDSIRVSQTWTAKTGCSGEDLKAIWIAVKTGDRLDDYKITETAGFDRKAVFRSEARAWLGL